MGAGLAGILVHLFTACGAGAGFLALDAAFGTRFAAMFAWLGVALVIDGIDGTFARWARVRERVPAINGDVLDLVVDYLTYVVVPTVALWRGDLLAPSLSLPVCLAVIIASALYFADTRMKTSDHWFRGFPALWNVLVFYLLVFRIDAAINVAIVACATVAMFLPIVFIHPMRVTHMRVPTLVVMAVFAVAAIFAVAGDLRPGVPVRVALGGCALYVLALPLLRRRVTA